MAAYGRTGEQGELRRELRRLLAEKAPVDALRDSMETAPFDRAVWSALASDLGLQSLLVPERNGGVGLGFVELAIALEELGATLACAPYLSTAIATATVLQAPASTVGDELLAAIAGEQTIATLAVSEGRDWSLDAVHSTATAAGGAHRLHGRKVLVTDAPVADVFLIVACTDRGVGVFAVRRGTPGLSVELTPSLDQTRGLGRLELDGAIGHPVIAAGEQAAVERALQLALIAIAAEQLGGARRCLELSVEHAKQRVQFGRPIGSFQAIKHLCADMLVGVETATAAVAYAAWAAAEQSAELPIVSSLVKAHVSEVYLSAAAATIQILGGMGYTWEHPAHLYYKRAASTSVLFGDPRAHREAVASLLEV